jgi:threonine dehydrogenase-like Zn-dependent dehydrogenase
MQALWLENNVLSFRDDLPVPDPPPGEARVRVRLAGICATDLELVRGYYPYTGVLGHEFVGVVVESSDDPAWVGQRVVGEINVACGKCETCRAGRHTHCEKRSVLGIKDRHGALAEYLTLPLGNLHRVPPSIQDEAAVLTEPLAAALEILQQVPIHPTDRVLVIGAGRLGQLIARTLVLTGCDLQVMARHENQVTLLKPQHIAVVPEGAVPSRCMDVVIEATGSPAGFVLARQAVRPRGTLVLKSTYKGDTRLDLSGMVVDEITLTGSRCGPFAPALRLLEREQVDPTPLIQERYALADGLAAFERAAQPGALKVLLQTP